MKAYLIKPEAQTIEEVDFAGTLEHLYELIDAPITERVTFAADGHSVDIWVDEEGLFRKKTLEKGRFRIGYHLLTGRGLVTGEIYNPIEGGSFGPVEWDLARFKTHVRF